MNFHLSIHYFIALLCYAVAKDMYNEELNLFTLHNHMVHATFNFKIKTDPVSVSKNLYDKFPRYLGEVINKYNVQELEVSLTQGTWRYGRWGLPVADSTRGPGAEVMVIFKEGTVDVDSKWKDLVNSLSGMVCASLNFMDSSITITPQYAFQPRGVVELGSRFNGSLIRYSLLPSENVCTENLAPWKKLLPCTFNQAGIASLLVPRKIFDSHYHSLSLRMMPVCSDSSCLTTSILLTQTLSVVLEPNVRSTRKERWTLTDLFGQSLGRVCPIATTSQINVITSVSGPRAVTIKEIADVVEEKLGFVKHQFNVEANMNIEVSYKQSSKKFTPPKPKFYANHFAQGWGQEKGRLVTEIVNGYDGFISVVYTHAVPWFIRPYMHTLKIHTEDQTLHPVKFVYVPGSGTRKQRRSHLLEIQLQIPANSTAKVSFSFDKVFMKWDEYPPDANLGLYAPPVVITAVIHEERHEACLQVTQDGGCVIRIYTEKVLIPMPTPDFSMPYNVLCLACTIVALGFGSIHTETVRTLRRKPKDEKTAISKFIEKIKAKLGIKSAEVKEDSKEEDIPSLDEKTEDSDTKEEDTTKPETGSDPSHEKSE